MLKLSNVKVILGKGTVLERAVLKGVNLNASTGEFVVIIGGNGAGKSTMLNVISGGILPDHGSIFLDGTNVTKNKQHLRALDVSIVMQDPKVGTMENMTIEENMSLAYLRGQTRGLIPYSNRTRQELFRDKLRMLSMGLENRLDELVSNLSGGQRQALALIMAIVTESKILLLDEITAALDPKAAETVMNITAKIVSEEKRTTLMITHNMSHAIEYGDKTLLLSNGKIEKEFSGVNKRNMTPLKLSSELYDV